MSLPTQPGPAQPTVTGFWQTLGRMFAALLASRAHADLVVTVRDGKVQLVRIDQRYLPTDLPRV
jgi:hypothetical protein